MECNGIDLNQNYSYIQCYHNLKDIKSKLKDQTIESFSVFLPYTYLSEEEELPHSWEATSDSITIYLANKFDLKNCYLIKNVDGIYVKIENSKQIRKQISISEFEYFKKENKLALLKPKNKEPRISAPIDSYALTLLEKYKSSCVLLNGTPPNSRIVEFFTKGDSSDTIYTQIIPTHT